MCGTAPPSTFTLFVVVSSARYAAWIGWAAARERESRQNLADSLSSGRRMMWYPKAPLTTSETSPGLSFQSALPNGGSQRDFGCNPYQPLSALEPGSIVLSYAS